MVFRGVYYLTEVLVYKGFGYVMTVWGQLKWEVSLKITIDIL